VDKAGCCPLPIKGRPWVGLYMGKPSSPCFLGMYNNSKECFNLKHTCVVFRTLTIENAKMYDRSLRLLRIRNNGVSTFDGHLARGIQSGVCRESRDVTDYHSKSRILTLNLETKQEIQCNCIILFYCVCWEFLSYTSLHFVKGFQNN
jgi:hypothetical protein